MVVLSKLVNDLISFFHVINGCINKSRLFISQTHIFYLGDSCVAHIAVEAIPIFETLMPIHSHPF
jgi:hypothetical protein